MAPAVTASASRAATSCFRSEEHTSELQSQFHLVCRLLLEKKNRSSRMIPPRVPLKTRLLKYRDSRLMNRKRTKPERLDTPNVSMRFLPHLCHRGSVRNARISMTLHRRLTDHELSANRAKPCCPLERIVRRHFFFNDTATTEIYTLSLHDALPI